MKYVALTNDGLSVVAVYPGPQPNLPNVVEVADNDPRFLAWSPNGPTPTVIPYEAFQSRFTAAEFNAATDYVEEINLTTGKPKRPALKQATARVWALGTVNLLHPATAQFMDALVVGGVLTAERKTVILTP